MSKKVKNIKENNSIDIQMDRIEADLLAQPQVDCPLVHRFTTGIYTREIFIPKGTWCSTKLHKTDHPFVVSQGKISVFTKKDGEVLIIAPYTGITTPGTRRLLYAHEDTIWTTFHATDKKDPIEIENDIIEKRDNYYLLNPSKKEVKE